jgi:alpha-1,6-mannosyltransferase
MTAVAPTLLAPAPVPAPAGAGRPWGRWGLLVAVAATTSGYLGLRRSAVAGWQFACALAALVAFASLMALEWRRPALSRRPIWAAAVVLLGVAVALPPQGSRDVWAYAMYGRMVSAHGASPYRHVPADFAHDPWEPRVAPAWRHSPSVYGPLFSGVSAAGMAVVGNSATAGRLFFQGLAALAVLGALLVVRRVRGDPLALAFIGINPVVISIVNGGHNDLLAGLAVLAGVVLAWRSRPGLAGAVLAAGALIKIAVLLPLAAVLAWLAWRHVGRRRRAGAGPAGVAGPLLAAAVAGAGLVAGYLVAGGWGAVAPIEQASTFESRSSMWGPHVLGRFFGHSDWWALAAAVVAALVVLAGGLRDRTPALAAGGAAAVYLVAAPYILPWYAGWAIPVLALAWRTRLAALALADASLLLLVHIDRAGLRPSWLHHGLQQLAARGLPGFELAAVAALCLLSARRAVAG